MGGQPERGAPENVLDVGTRVGCGADDGSLARGADLGPRERCTRAASEEVLTALVPREHDGVAMLVGVERQHRHINDGAAHHTISGHLGREGQHALVRALLEFASER